MFADFSLLILNFDTGAVHFKLEFWPNHPNNFHNILDFGGTSLIDEASPVPLH